MNHALSDVSVKQLKRAIKIKKKLEALQAKFDGIFGAGREAPATRRKRKVSAAGRARMAASQRARWAKLKGKVVGRSAKKDRRKMSAASRGRIAAAARARWKKAKAAGKNRL